MHLSLSSIVWIILLRDVSCKIFELTDDNFNSEIVKNDNAFVMFYSPWCRHCKNFKPEFESASKSLEHGETPVRFFQLDCNGGGKVTCNKMKISGYPTLKIFKDGEVLKDYKGPRFSEAIVKNLISELGPAVRNLTSKHYLEQYLEEPKTVVILYWKNKSDNLKIIFGEVAVKMKEHVRFGVYEGEEESNVERIVVYQAAHLRNKFEPWEHEYHGEEDQTEIENWIRVTQHGLVGHRHTGNKEDFKPPLVVGYYRVDYTKNPKGTNYWRNRILKVARSFEEDFHFAISSKEDFSHELSEFGDVFPRTDKPVVYARSESNKKYVMESEFSMDNFAKFLNELRTGQLEPYVKSEPIPNKTEEAVVPVVAKNFDSVITDNGKDTLLAFYAHWCGHCRKLSPIYKELAEKLSGEDLVVAKMNAAENEVQSHFEIEGYPTLYFIPKNDRYKPIKYTGNREINDLIKFLAKHTDKEMKGYKRDGTPKEPKEEL